ncbi:MAG: hypothetical protein J1D77_08485 [Muribaculaceae bacterium]|nr:hypothetical protein [Muribaculaceae bacterium]
MKRFLLSTFFFFFLSSIIFSQSINYDNELQTDNSEWVKISPNSIWLSVKKLNMKSLLVIDIISDAMLTFNPGNAMIIKDSNGSVAQFLPTGDFSSSLGGGAIDDIGKEQMGVKITYEGNVDFLVNNPISSIIITFSGGEIPLTISTFTSNEIQQKLSYYGSKNKLKSYNVEYYRKKKTDSNWELIRKEIRILNKEEIKELKKAWDSKTDGDFEYKCKIKKRYTYIY